MKAFVKQIIQFLTYSNSWIGLGAAAFAWKYYIITETKVNFPVVLFIFFSTALTYTFQRYVKLGDSSYGKSQRFDWMKRYPILIKLILLISAIGTVWGLTALNLNSFYLLGILGFLSFFYIIKIPGLSNLRNIPFLKIFLIALVWAGTSTLLPALNQPVFEWNNALNWLMLTDFVFVLGITIPFDIRDLKVDDAYKKTIPQVLGTKWAIVLAITLVLIQYLILVQDFTSTNAYITTCLLITIVIIGLSRKKRNDLYFSFWVDGLLIMQPLCFYLYFIGK